MQAAGSPLLRLQALQLAAQLLLQDPGRVLQQEQHKQQQQQQQQQVILPLDESPLLLEALQLLQVCLSPGCMHAWCALMSPAGRYTVSLQEMLVMR
jgi:hypothetical protein